MAPLAQAAISEECNFYKTCGLLAPLTAAGKPVWNVEYTSDWGSGVQADLSKFCPGDLAAGIDGTLMTQNLSGQRNACQ